VARPARPDAHQALLEAARAEFSRRGLERARVEDISRRAGISKGAFYLHFRTKDDAFNELLQRFLGALEALAQRRVSATAEFDVASLGRPRSADAMARWFALECALDVELLELLWANRLLQRVLDGAGGHRWSKPMDLFRQRMRALAAGRVAERQAAGLLRADLDPEAIGDLVLGGFESFARRMADLKTRPDLAAWADSFLKVLYLGLLAPTTLPSSPALPAPRTARRASR
jgi:AcrR family transcriptional regulator